MFNNCCRLCIVPVELHLQNCSNSDVVIRLEASGATTRYVFAVCTSKSLFIG